MSVLPCRFPKSLVVAGSWRWCLLSLCVGLTQTIDYGLNLLHLSSFMFKKCISQLCKGHHHLQKFNNLYVVLFWKLKNNTLLAYKGVFLLVQKTNKLSIFVTMFFSLDIFFYNSIQWIHKNVRYNKMHVITLLHYIGM